MLLSFRDWQKIWNIVYSESYIRSEVIFAFNRSGLLSVRHFTILYTNFFLTKFNKVWVTPVNVYLFHSDWFLFFSVAVQNHGVFISGKGTLYFLKYIYIFTTKYFIDFLNNEKNTLIHEVIVFFKPFFIHFFVKSKFMIAYFSNEIYVTLYEKHLSPIFVSNFSEILLYKWLDFPLPLYPKKYPNISLKNYKFRMFWNHTGMAISLKEMKASR